jgi:NAD(P)-dependent dehydrogenase (short-subunit alcohol dehydrogenase family)
MTSALFNIKDATALVTGGSRGIGLSIARGLVEAGATVFISARQVAECDAAAHLLSENGTCISLPCDVGSVAAIADLATRIGERTQRLNILVNNAGATSADPIETFPEAEWDSALDVNLKAPFFLVQKLLPLLRAAGTAENPARIINVGSVAGINPMARNSYAYAASKAALHHLTKVMARNLAPTVNVNAIAPGAFETRMIAFALANRAALEAQIPRGHVGQGDDVAGVAIFLASRAGAYLTGAVIPVDGGLALRNP